jgi:hypothetical protein
VDARRLLKRAKNDPMQTSRAVRERGRGGGDTGARSESHLAVSWPNITAVEPRAFVPSARLTARARFCARSSLPSLRPVDAAVTAGESASTRNDAPTYPQRAALLYPQVFRGTVDLMQDL